MACSQVVGVELMGHSEVAGSPSKFIALCEGRDLTALAIQEAVPNSDCAAAGSFLATVDTINFNKSALDIVNLGVLDGLSNLKSISAYGRKIDDVSALSGLIRLEELYLMQNEIRDISFLAPLQQLKYLRLDGNNIVDISVLSELKRLEKLGLDANEISDFRPLADLPNVQDLNTNFNPVDLSTCPDGEKVYKDLRKYCRRMKKNNPDLQGAIDPK
jgi:internalin A